MSVWDGRVCVLGHVVGNGTVCPQKSKLKAVESFEVPTMKTQVRTFLDLTGYYWRFITEYATTAAPLSDLTKKLAPNQVEWSPQCNSAFQALKRHLCRSPILNSPDFEKPFILQIDASNRGVGAVLSQLDASGYDHL